MCCSSALFSTWYQRSYLCFYSWILQLSHVGRYFQLPWLSSDWWPACYSKFVSQLFYVRRLCNCYSGEFLFSCYYSENIVAVYFHYREGECSGYSCRYSSLVARSTISDSTIILFVSVHVLSTAALPGKGITAIYGRGCQAADGRRPSDDLLSSIFSSWSVR